MPDIKISELLPASTPLDGTETLPIVQSGNTVKASTQDIASLYSLGYTAEDVANKSTDSSFAGATDLKYPSQLAVKTYVDNTLGNAGWGLSGNSGTTSANFIGTTNAQDLVFKTNSTERLRIGANGGIQSLQYITSTNGVSSTAIGYGWIEMFNQSGGLAEINATNITGTKSLQLPNTNGTLVATVNGVAPDSAGNVSATEDYLVYTALIDANSGSPIATVLKNTLGVNINWTNPFNGQIRGTASSGNPFTISKTWISSGSYDNAGQPYFVTSQRMNDTQVRLKFYLYDGTITATPNFISYSVEIRVYP